MTNVYIYDAAASAYRPAADTIAAQPESVREALWNIVQKIDAHTLTASSSVTLIRDGLWRCMVVGEGNRWVDYNFARDEKALKPPTVKFVKPGDIIGNGVVEVTYGRAQQSNQDEMYGGSSIRLVPLNNKER